MFNNQGGTIEVDANTLALEEGTDTGGTFVVAAGATLDLSGNSGSLSGSYTGSGGGTVALASGTLDIDAGGRNVRLPGRHVSMDGRRYWGWRARQHGCHRSGRRHAEEP